MNKRSKRILGSCLCICLAAACGGDDKSTSSPSTKDKPSHAKAGSSEPVADAAAPDDGAEPDQTLTDIDFTKDIRGLCDINSGYADDHACMPAPPPEMGMQIHIGPSNYDDPEEVAKFIMHPGEESSQCFTVLTPNDRDIHYQTSVLSGRAGTHHIIGTLYEGDVAQDNFHSCQDQGGGAKSLGSAPGASKAYMPRLSVAPEYAHVGRLLPAHSTYQGDMHYFNFTDKDIIREVWLNIYYVDDAEITEEAKQIAALGGFGWNSNPIQPSTDHVYPYQCPVKGDGYIMMLLGHYHAHGKRFTATITRKATGMTEKVFEMFDYLDPAQFEYNSVVENPAFSDSASGAVSGRLPVYDGDVVNWECHIVNDSDVPLRYVNQVKTGEMCNLWGSSIGIQPINCFSP